MSASENVSHIKPSFAKQSIQSQQCWRRHDFGRLISESVKVLISVIPLLFSSSASKFLWLTTLLVALYFLP